MKTLSIIAGFLIGIPLAFAVGEPLEPVPQTVQGIFEQPVVGEMVNLKGSIIEDLGSQKYLFKDDTGQIKLNISSEVMVSDKIKAEDDIEIYGQIKDSTQDKFIVDVSLLTVTQKLRIPNTIYGTTPSSENTQEEPIQELPAIPFEPKFEPESEY